MVSNATKLSEPVDNTKLPSGWFAIPLAKMADKDKVNSFIDGDWIEARYIESQGIRLIQTGNIGIGRFKDKDKKKYVSEKTFEELKCKEVFPGDILICRLADPIGRACIVPNTNERLITAVDVTIFRPEEAKYSSDFLIQLLNYQGTLDKVSSYTSGSTRQRISRSNLGNVVLSVPPLLEQRKIAAILSSVDAAIEKTDAIIKQTEKVIQGLMQRLLTKGIGHTTFKQTEIGEIPIEWQTLTLEEVGKWSGGGTPSKSRPDFWTSDVGILWVSPKDMNDVIIKTSQDKITDSGLKDKGLRQLPVGTILFVTRSGILRNSVPIALAGKELTINQDLKALQVNSQYNHKFVFYTLKTFEKKIRNSCVKSGTTVESVDFPSLKSFRIPVPNRKEQDKIASIAEGYYLKLINEQKYLESLKTLKQGLIQVLLTGKVRVKVDDNAEVVV